MVDVENKRNEAMNKHSLGKIQFDIEDHWRSSEYLKTLIGVKVADGNNVIEWCFGDIPTEKAIVYTRDGRIARIQTFSGMNWSAKNGRGAPTVDVSQDRCPA